MSRKRYKVRPAPGISEDAGITYMAVIGPRVGEFAFMERMARVLEAALNAADAFAATEGEDKP